jgi:putative ABC transport system ATP-binding protein
MPGPVVELHNVTKHYHRGEEDIVALKEVSFTLEPAEMVALMGPSGCGKSTALNLIGGIDRPDGGTLTVCGIDLNRASESDLVRLRRKRVGFVFQAFHLMPHLSVLENVSLPLALDGKRDEERVRYLLGRVGLSHRLMHYPSELSGGEQQRAAVARALAHRPSLVLADEPTGNLDSESGQSVLRVMIELREEEGTAFLVATHDQRVADLKDRTLRLRDGRLMASAGS